MLYYCKHICLTVIHRLFNMFWYWWQSRGVQLIIHLWKKWRKGPKKRFFLPGSQINLWWGMRLLISSINNLSFFLFKIKHEIKRLRHDIEIRASLWALKPALWGIRGYKSTTSAFTNNAFSEIFTNNFNLFKKVPWIYYIRKTILHNLFEM